MSKSTDSVPKPAKSKLPKLTKQEKKFVEIKAITGNGTFAAKEAFAIEDPNYAGVKANRLLRKDKIVNAIQEALPDELLAEVHKEGLFATKPNFEKQEDGTYENVSDEPDYAVRHKYLDSAYKLKGSYAAEKSISITAQVNIENKQQVEGIASKVLEQMKNDEIV